MWESGEDAESGHRCVCSWLKIFFRFLCERTCDVVVMRSWAPVFVMLASLRQKSRASQRYAKKTEPTYQVQVPTKNTGSTDNSGANLPGQRDTSDTQNYHFPRNCKGKRSLDVVR